MSSIHETVAPNSSCHAVRSAPQDETGALLSALLDQLPVGVVIADRDGRFEYINAIAETLSEEHERARLSLEPWASLADAPASELGPIHWILARALLIGEIVRDEEVEYLDSHDEWRTLSVSATPVRGVRGEVERVVVTFIDVTLRNRARDWEPVMRSLSRL